MVSDPRFFVAILENITISVACGCVHDVVLQGKGKTGGNRGKQKDKN